MGIYLLFTEFRFLFGIFWVFSFVFFVRVFHVVGMLVLMCKQSINVVFMLNVLPIST